MNEKEWALQYTDDQYLTKRELVQAMHTSLVDGYWLDIRAYRGKNAQPLPHRTISNQRFWLCMSVGVRAKIATFEDSLTHLLGVVGKIDDPKVKEEIIRSFLLTCLSEAAKFSKTNISPLSIKALLNGTYHENNSDHLPIISYLKTLRYFLSKDPSKPDADFLGEAYGSLLGEEELTKFYRNFDFDQSASRARFMTGGDFRYAPFEAIEPLMNEFFVFAEDEHVSMAPRAAGSLYFLDLVKPFGEKNQELAALLAKAIIAKGTGSNLAFLLPFEALLEPGTRYDSLFLETQHSGDLTYIVLQAIDVLTPLLASFESQIKEIRVAAYRSEMRPLSPEEQTIADERKTPVPPTQMSLLEEKPTPSEEPKQVVPPSIEPIVQAKAEISEPTPVVAPPESKPVAKPVSPKPVQPPLPKADIGGSLAIQAPEATLSEKEIKEYIQYLLESNPNLNKNQATFLSNHCTMGHYYTIQQFKKDARCAYETARTSMDKLAHEGYYEKKQLKNKFVYTPVKQGEKN